jgi:uncharacterized membrane protein
MPGDPRPWERRHVRDREPSRSLSCAITSGLGLVVLMTMFVVGFTAGGLAIGIGIGIVVLIVLASLARRTGGGRHRPPPADLL